jgi:hypothetical protein
MHVLNVTRPEGGSNMSEQERNDEQTEQTDQPVQDLDVNEEQQDDVLGGAMRQSRDERKK